MRNVIKVVIKFFKAFIFTCFSPVKMANFYQSENKVSKYIKYIVKKTIWSEGVVRCAKRKSCCFFPICKKDDTRMTSMKIIQFSRIPSPLAIYVQSSSTLLTLDVQFQTNTPSLQMVTNQWKENIIQGWLLYVIRSFLSFSVSTH